GRRPGPAFFAQIDAYTGFRPRAETRGFIKTRTAMREDWLPACFLGADQYARVSCETTGRPLSMADEPSLRKAPQMTDLEHVVIAADGGPPLKLSEGGSVPAVAWTPQARRLLEGPVLATLLRLAAPTVALMLLQGVIA